MILARPKTDENPCKKFDGKINSKMIKIDYNHTHLIDF